MPAAHINIGSNLGDSLSEIRKAVAEITFLSQLPVRCSAPVESAAWGYESANRYINVGVEITTDLQPGELLEKLLEIERKLSPLPHRDAVGHYIDRLLDIDLIYYDELIIDTPQLQLPHPRLHLREFVLKPIAELAPGWRHPANGLSAREMLSILLPGNFV